MLASAGATLEQITGAEPAPDAYKMADHWWGMIIDIDKCIGCGNCVRACSNENHVPAGYFRTWVERYQVPEDQTSRPASIRPTAPSTASRPPPTPASRASSSPSSATTAPIRLACRSAPWAPPSSAPMAWCWWIKPTAWAAATACRPALTAAATCIPIPETVDKCTLCYHRITQGLTTACCENCPTGARQLVDFKNPKDPVHEFLRHNKVQVLKPYMATGAKVYYKDLDGSVR